MIIFRYLSKELYSSILAITLILLIIFVTNQFIHYLKNAASGQITMATVIQIMSLQIPLLLGYLLPLGLYLSILIAYGRLYVEHEMTVLSSCGMSRAQLIGMTMIISLIIMLIVAALMLWVEPIVQGYRTRILDQAITNMSVQKIVPKRFQNLHDQHVFYTDRLSREKQTMYQVFLAKLSPEKMIWEVSLSQAAREQFVDGLRGKFIIFQNGSRYVGVPGQKNFQTVEFQHYGFRFVASGVHLNDWPNSVPTFDLLHLIKTEKNPARLRMLQAIWQWRLAMPISVILFTLLAFPLSEVNPRSGKFARLFPAILIYIVYADLMFLGRAWIERGAISPALGLWWIHGIMIVVVTFLNGFQIGWRRIFSTEWFRRRSYAHS